MIFFKKLLNWIDFGLSKISGEDFKDTSDYGAWPLKWLSPETLKEHTFDNKTDVWSFGILIIEVLTRYINLNTISC